MLSSNEILIPADVPKAYQDIFIKNYNKATGNTGKLMLFAGDQKVEHLNNDYYGKGIPADAAYPQHLFQIAAEARVGVFATQFGLMCRYASSYQNIPLLVKLNGKSNLLPISMEDPCSRAWLTVDQIISRTNDTQLNVLGFGYTVYLGSRYERTMLQEAAKMVHDAHAFGKIAILWMYPKGQAVNDERDAHTIAGAAGIANCLGADFVKIKLPLEKGEYREDLLTEIVAAAGNTGVICEGGAKKDVALFLGSLYRQINHYGIRGSATGRNIYQNNLVQSIAIANAIYAITVENKGLTEVITELKKNHEIYP